MAAQYECRDDDKSDRDVGEVPAFVRVLNHVESLPVAKTWSKVLSVPYGVARPLPHGSRNTRGVLDRAFTSGSRKRLSPGR